MRRPMMMPMTGLPVYPTPYYGNSNTPMAMPGPPYPEPITKHGTGNAAEDGYTIYGRRLRGDTPGDILPIEEVERIESAYNGRYLNDF